MDPQPKVAVFGRKVEPAIRENVLFFIQKLQSFGCNVYIYEPYFQKLFPQTVLNNTQINTFCSHTEIDNSFNFFFCIGGDGTFLEAVRFVRNSGVPVIGINMGRLGFLANIPRHEIENSLQAIFSNNYSIEERNLLGLETDENPFVEFPHAINEITVQKHDSSLITIEVKINGNELNTYWADGLIISTPTGSTAYSMSAGGPIVSPECPVFIISPIASHNLTVRPIVIANNYEIHIRAFSRSGSYLVTLDSLSSIFTTGTQLKISLAGFRVNLVQLPNHGFFSTIRNKLMWGADIRN